MQKNILLRDERGPVLQVTYYENSLALDPEVAPKALLRCIGRMVCRNRMVAFKIGVATADMRAHLDRMTIKSEHAINRLNA